MATDEDQDREKIIQRRGRTQNLSILSLRAAREADSWTGFKHALFSNVITSLTPRILLLASEHMVSFLHNQLDLNLNRNINIQPGIYYRKNLLDGGNSNKNARYLVNLCPFLLLDDKRQL